MFKQEREKGSFFEVRRKRKRIWSFFGKRGRGGGERGLGGEDFFLGGRGEGKGETDFWGGFFWGGFFEEWKGGGFRARKRMGGRFFWKKIKTGF